MISRIIRLFRNAAAEFSRDECMQKAAALAYYTVFSLPPMLVVVTSLAGLIAGEEVILEQLQSEAAGVVGEDGSEQLLEIMDNAQSRRSGTMGPLVSVGILVFGATGVLVQLQGALNQAWNVTPEARKGGLVGFLLSRLLSFALLLALAFVLVVSLTATALIEFLEVQVDSLLPGTLVSEGVQVAQALTSLAMVTVLFAMMYKWLPDRSVEWRDVWFGAVLTGILMTVAKIALGFYLGSGNIESTYGAAGALVLILAWVYYSAIVFLFGAELTQCRMRMRNPDESA